MNEKFIIWLLFLSLAIDHMETLREGLIMLQTSIIDFTGQAMSYLPLIVIGANPDTRVLSSQKRHWERFCVVSIACRSTLCHSPVQSYISTYSKLSRIAKVIRRCYQPLHLSEEESGL